MPHQQRLAGDAAHLLQAHSIMRGVPPCRRQQSRGWRLSMQCAGSASCFTAFHPLCARAAGYAVAIVDAEEDAACDRGGALVDSAPGDSDRENRDANTAGGCGGDESAVHPSAYHIGVCGGVSFYAVLPMIAPAASLLTDGQLDEECPVATCRRAGGRGRQWQQKAEAAAAG